MRAPFNTTCDIVAGPGSLTPGLFKGTWACRLVLQNDIDLLGPDAPLRPYWLTLQGIAPIGMWTAPELSVNDQVADRIAVPAGTPTQWFVLWTESVIHGLQPLYYRSHLETLPAPNPDSWPCADAKPLSLGVPITDHIEWSWTHWYYYDAVGILPRKLTVVSTIDPDGYDAWFTGTTCATKVFQNDNYGSSWCVNLPLTVGTRVYFFLTVSSLFGPNVPRDYTISVLPGVC